MDGTGRVRVDCLLARPFAPQDNVVVLAHELGGWCSPDRRAATHEGRQHVPTPPSRAGPVLWAGRGTFLNRSVQV